MARATLSRATSGISRWLSSEDRLAFAGPKGSLRLRQFAPASSGGFHRSCSSTRECTPAPLLHQANEASAGTMSGTRWDAFNRAV